MAQVLPQSFGSHLMGKPSDTQDSPSLPVREQQPHPEPFHFPAAPDGPSTAVASMPEKPSHGPSRSSGVSPTGSASKKHTRKQMSLALPAFSFNPGAVSEQEPGPATPSTPLSPLTGAPNSSPSRGGRHRRVQSEFIGGDPGRSPISTRESSPMTDEVTFRDFANDLPPVAKSPSKGHRHRRSGAMSSQDLSSVAPHPSLSTAKDSKTLVSDVNMVSPTFPPPGLSASNRPGAEYLRFATESPGTSKSSSPVRVSFAENIEVIPRRSLPSLRNQPIPASARAIHSSDGPRATRPVSAPSRGLELRQSPLNTFGSWLADGSGVMAEPTNDAGSSLDDIPYALPLEVVDEAPVEVDGEVQTSLPGTFSFPDNFEDSDEQFGEPGFATLSEDFDGDPTSADMFVQPHFSQSSHFSDMRSSVPESSDSVVDLDSALELSDSAVPIPTIEELRILRSKSFSAARHSMHSSGWPTSATSSLHRRTESAPSLPMPTFDRPTVSRFNSASASEKGFEMENVFEEDEEVAEAEAAAALAGSDQDASSIVIGESDRQNRRQPQRSTTSDTVTPDSSPSKTSSTIKANKWLTETALRDSVSTITPDLLANIPSDDFPDSRSQPHSLMSSPPATPGTPSGIWASSTCDDWATDGASAPYSEASSFVDSQQLGPPKALAEGGRPSSEGTPSLISSRSTMNSGPRRQGSNAASPHTLDSATLDGPRSSSGSSHVRWHKRSSIASLSRLMTGTGSTRSHLSMEYTPRCQTSDGLHDESKDAKDQSGKRKRLGRLLKYFRPKDAKEQAPG